jgi:hypothetical protein
MPYPDLDKILKETILRNKCHPLNGLNYPYGSSISGAAEFLKECLGKIPPGIYRFRARADSGFFDHKFIEPVDQEGIGYVIVAKMTRPIRNRIGTLRYHKFKRDWAAGEFFHQPFGWKKPHRFVVIRCPLPEKDSEQLTLFTLKRYAYQVFVTTLPLKTEKIWYFYRPRNCSHRTAFNLPHRPFYKSRFLTKNCRKDKILEMGYAEGAFSAVCHLESE